MALFALEDLTFAYPESSKDALRGVNLQVRAGEYLCLMGRSGCGKTTLLRQFKSVLVPHGVRSGSVLFDGVPLDEVPLRDQSSRIGFVMQDPDAQIVTDKVWHELAFGLESLGCDQAVMRLRVAEMASCFGMQDWFHKDVHQLSGGQKQLLNLASVMAMQPDVLILDEPTAQLDPIAAADLLGIIRKINLELGTTVIITEHRLEDVYAVADRVVVMEDGRITVAGPPRQVSEALHEQRDAMAYGLPSPVRVFYGVEQADSSEPAAPGACPLTVREGRAWLSERVEEWPPSSRELPAGACDAPGDDRALQLKGVWFRYGKDAPDVLKGVDLEVPKGRLFSLVGGNGAGKSTLLKCVCGAVKPYRGKIRILGKRLEDWKESELFAGGLGMLPQDPANIFVKETVRGELEEMSSDASRQAEVVQLCALEDLLDRHPLDLSGGEQQRAALAKVLLTDPRVLLLDEPTKGLDSFFKRQLAGLLKNLTDAGTTILMVSHDVEFCARHADAVSMFFDGGVVATDAPRAFFSSNGFYTTAANRMSRHVFKNAITDEDVIELCLS